MYRTGTWSHGVHSAYLYLWTPGGLLWRLPERSGHGQADVFDGGEELTTWASTGLGPRAVASARGTKAWAAGPRAPALRSAPRTAVLASAGETVAFGSWTLTRGAGEEVTVRNADAAGVSYVLSVREQALRGFDGDRKKDDVTLGAVSRQRRARSRCLARPVYALQPRRCGKRRELTCAAATVPLMLDACFVQGGAADKAKKSIGPRYKVRPYHSLIASGTRGPRLPVTLHFANAPWLWLGPLTTAPAAHRRDAGGGGGESKQRKNRHSGHARARLEVGQTGA